MAEAQNMNVGFSSVDAANEDAPVGDTYWATLPKDQIGAHLVDRVTEYDNYTRSYGFLWLWRRSYFMYYKNYFRGGKILRAGEQGQYKTLSVNHYRSIMRGVLDLVTAEKPAFTPQATNTDYKTQAQVEASKSILDFAAKYDELSKTTKAGTEKAVLYGEATFHIDLDANAGKIIAVDPNTNRPIYDGRITVGNYSPADAIRDTSLNTASACGWWIFRDYKNKWDLAAIYPEYKDEILGAGVDSDLQLRRFGHAISEAADDTVCLYTFVHKPTPALPNGRIIKFVTADAILLDTALPFGWQVYRLTAADQEETTFGFTAGFDLLAIQEALDKLISVIVTNQLTFGVQNIVAPLGTKLSPQQLMEGLNLILTDTRAGVPTALELCKTPAELFQFIEFLIQQMEIIGGLNSVSRGVAPKNLESGTALAFLESQSIQANSGLQESYNRLLEDIGTGYLKILKSRPNDPKLMGIVGQANRQYLSQFGKADLADIELVTVERVNPLTKTTAGRIEIANSLLQYKLIKTPEEFMAVVETGQLGSLTEGSMSELMHIREETEALRNGQMCKVHWADNHPLHIKEHMAALNSVSIRNSNDPAVAAASAHIQDHLMMWQNLPPNVLAGLGIQPPPVMAPGAPGVVPGAEGATPTDPKAGAANAAPPTPPVQPAAPEGPRPPNNASPQDKERMARSAANRQ